MPTLLRLFGMSPLPPVHALDAFADAAGITILGNVLLQLKVATSSTSAWRERNQIASIVVDVRLKRPFDGSLQPAIGELVMQSVETILNGCIRSSDSVIRTAEQQFSIVLNRVTGAEGISRAFARIVRNLEYR